MSSSSQEDKAARQYSEEAFVDTCMDAIKTASTASYEKDVHDAHKKIDDMFTKFIRYGFHRGSRKYEVERYFQKKFLSGKQNAPQQYAPQQYAYENQDDDPSLNHNQGR